MSEAKCPLCNGDLIQSEAFPYFYSCQSTNWESIADKLCELDDCAASVPVWEALRRTRNALDIAVKRLGYIKNNYKSWTPDRDVQMIAQAVNGLDEIKTALEQKDKR